MANWGAWMNARRALEKNSNYEKEKTTVTYSKIKKLDLETINWLDFSPENEKDLIEMNKRISNFVEEFGPCLFIWDPKIKSLNKAFLVDVKDFKVIKEWQDANKNDLFNYSYLITTQVLGIKSGFVGNVFSDGQGNIICETLHKPYIFNQWELSQPKEDISQNLEFFITEDFELVGRKKGLISRESAMQIIKLFGLKKGYFEFSKGLHNGKISICVIGFEGLDFPKGLYDSIYFDLRKIF